MYAACREQRNAHAAPKSAGSPSLRMGAAATAWVICSSGSTPRDRAMSRNLSVRIASGARQFTVIPSGASSRARVLARPVTPARIALEITMFGIGWRTEIDVMKTIRPWSDCLRWGSAALTRRTALRSVSWKPASHASSGVVWNVPGGGPPALTMTMSSPPSTRAASPTRRSGSSSFETSEASHPAAPISRPVASG